MKIKTLVAVIALAASGSANAAIQASGFDGQGGELFLTVWNPAAESSYGLDLDVLFTDMLPINNVNNLSGDAAGFTRDLSADANWTSVTAGATSGLKFAVTGGVGGVVWNSSYTGYVNGATGAMSTAVDGDQLLVQAPILAVISPLVAYYDSMASRLNIADNDGGTDGSSFVTVGDNAYFNNPANLWGNVDFIYDMEGMVDGGDIGFFFNQTNHTGWAEDGDTLSQLGNFSLTTNGQLTYTPVSAVPVPAALWLFGSGLVGLVGIARRKKLQA